MVFKIEELEHALHKYMNVVGEIENKSDRKNINKRQAFMNAFVDEADIYQLRDLFSIKDTNNIRYAFKKHKEKLLTYLDYNENFSVAKSIRIKMLNKKSDEKLFKEAKTFEIY
jgi:hypothetical protein